MDTVAFALIDGVAGFWVPAPGPMSVALVFGVGVNDERLTHRGINHLIEADVLAGALLPADAGPVTGAGGIRVADQLLG